MTNMLTKKDLEGATLFDDLLDRLNESNEVVADTVLGNSPDKRRFFTGNLRVAVWARDDGFCRYCGKRLDPTEWEADHVVPHARGGQTVVENGAAACKPCNGSKGDRWW